MYFKNIAFKALGATLTATIVGLTKVIADHLPDCACLPKVYTFDLTLNKYCAGDDIKTSSINGRQVKDCELDIDNDVDLDPTGSFITSVTEINIEEQYDVSSEEVVYGMLLENLEFEDGDTFSFVSAAGSFPVNYATSPSKLRINLIGTGPGIGTVEMDNQMKCSRRRNNHRLG